MFLIENSFRIAIETLVFFDDVMNDSQMFYFIFSTYWNIFTLLHLNSVLVRSFPFFGDGLSG